MRLSARNFGTKQVGSWWVVLGPGGKILPGRYRLQSQALVALKEEVNKMLSERNFGFLKETSERINQKLEKELTNEKETPNDDGKGTDIKESNDEGYSHRQEKTEGNAKTKEKKVKKLTKTTSQLKRKFNV